MTKEVYNLEAFEQLYKGAREKVQTDPTLEHWDHYVAMYNRLPPLVFSHEPSEQQLAEATRRKDEFEQIARTVAAALPVEFAMLDPILALYRMEQDLAQ